MYAITHKKANYFRRPVAQHKSVCSVHFVVLQATDIAATNQSWPSTEQNQPHVLNFALATERAVPLAANATGGIYGNIKI